MLVFAAAQLAAETTLYVGKHFEVRDHDAPVKYVFNGGTRVARITGSLSTNTRIQRFRLRPGWNLLSLAVSATNVFDQLQRPGVITSARAWNPQAGSYSPVPQVAPAGTILWVNATTNATIAVTGSYLDPVNRPVSAGATYLPGPGLEAWTPTLPPSVVAWSFDPQPSTLNSPPTWLARLTGDLSSVNDLPYAFPPGQALYVINDAPFELEIPDPALRIRYYQQDHLGSSSVMTDANGALVEETALYPFGIPRHEHRVRQIEEPYKFTQKERDRESGLHHFEARFLAALSGRFISVDPKYAALEAATPDPQQLNLYAYARNSPVLYVDPTGLDSGIPEAAGSFDEIDVDTTAEAIGGFLGSTWLGAAIKAPPKINDAASFIGGIGDGIVDPIGDLAGCKTFGMGFGRFTRLAFGISSVDTSSPDYGGGKFLGTLATFATGGAEAVALSAARRAPAVAKSVVDPLAKTQVDVFAKTQPMASKGPGTVGSRGSGVGEVRAPISGAATTGGQYSAEFLEYMAILEETKAIYRPMQIISLNEGLAYRFAVQAAENAWIAKYGTKPPVRR